MSVTYYAFFAHSDSIFYLMRHDRKFGHLGDPITALLVIAMHEGPAQKLIKAVYNFSKSNKSGKKLVTFN